MNTTQKTIPNSWTQKRLGQIASLYDGDWILSKDLETGNDVRLLQLGDIGDGKFLNKTSKYISDSRCTELGCTLLKSGDILIARLGDPVGKSCLLDGVKGKTITSVDVAITRPKEEVQPEYLLYLINSDPVRKSINSAASGSTRKRISRSNLEKIELWIPTRLEQANISEILGAVDGAIQKTEEIIAATDKLKKGLMQELFTQGIGHTKFKKTKIGNMPTEWELVRLRDVAKFTNGKAHEKDIDENGKYIVVNSKFISTNGRVFKRTDKPLSPLSIGDIAMVMSDIPKGKAIAKCFFVEENEKYTLNQRICSLRSTRINNWFLFFALNRNKYFLDFDNGVGQTNLRKDEVLNCPIQLPPKHEQQKIVEMLSAVDGKVSVNKRVKGKLDLLKKGLMQDLLSGKVRVPTT